VIRLRHRPYDWGVADVDLRLVRYFTVVAAHGNFHRAAAELRVAQPSLSRQIQRLEQILGVRLLDRTPRGSSLTEAGRAFLPAAEELLRAAERAIGAARFAPPAITVGYAGGLRVTAAIDSLRRIHPDAEVRTRHLDWASVRPALLAHRVDIAVARVPIPVEGLDVTLLYREPRVLLVPAGHRLAGLPAVTLASFATAPLVRYPDAAYDAYWRLDPRPDGSRAPDGPVVSGHADKLECIAGGRALALAPAGDGTETLRRDVVAVPVSDIEPCEVVLASRAGEGGPLLTALAGVLRDRVDQPAHVGDQQQG
jgi:DNA-binding transcriptional LysR family regulator